MSDAEPGGWYAVVWTEGVGAYQRSYLIDFDQKDAALDASIKLARWPQAEEVRVIGPVPCPELDALLKDAQERIWRGIAARMGLVPLEEAAG